MKKGKIAKMVFMTFIKAMGVMILFLAVGVAGYFATMMYFNFSSKTERATTYKHVIDVETGNDSSNLIYSYDEKSRKINRIVLELYHADTNNLDYVTIPSGTNLEVSQETFTKMLEESQEVPQIVRLSRMCKYFSGDVAFEYGIMALEDNLGIDIGYFTAMESMQFERIFENYGTSTEPYYAPTKSILDEASQCSDSYELSDMVEKYWPQLISDITLKQRQKYSTGFKKIHPEYIHMHRVEGEMIKKTFTINQEKTRNLLRQLARNSEYKSADPKFSAATSTSTKKKTDNKSAKDQKLSIQVTNASRINGLAAHYKDLLEADGYTVQGTGNYIGEVKADTVIRVHKKGQGDSLLSYFKAAKIEVTTDGLTEGADIEIVLGTKDKVEE